MIQVRSDDLRKFAEVGYMALQNDAKKTDNQWKIVPWEEIRADAKVAWVAAAEAIISSIKIVEVEQKTVVYVPEIRFSEPK